MKSTATPIKVFKQRATISLGGRARLTSVLEQIKLNPKVVITIIFIAVMAMILFSRNSKANDPNDLYQEKCHMAPSVSQDRRKDKEKIVVMNFNTEWLFLHGGTGQIKCPGECTWKTQDEAQLHADNIVKMIKREEPDIIHLSEVEGCQTLEYIAKQLGPDYRHYLVPGTDTTTGQQVGLITKIDPITNLIRSTRSQTFPSEEEGSSFSSTTVSKHYVTKFKIGEEYIVIIGLHLIAFPDDKSRGDRREAQAIILRRLVDEVAHPDESVIVLGDFNDLDNEVMGQDNGKSITQVLDIFKYSKKGRTLFNALDRIPQQFRFSAWHDVNLNCVDDGVPEHSLIDHILLSKNLYRRVVSAQSHRDFIASCESRFSDHWPVSVIISTK